MRMNGPGTMSRNERLQVCCDISERLQKVYGEAILATGVYGSVARGTDGPFSDIEIHLYCAVQVNLPRSVMNGPPVPGKQRWTSAAPGLCSNVLLL
jgi:predicted nucleotidyltransferase